MVAVVEVSPEGVPLRHTPDTKGVAEGPVAGKRPPVAVLGAVSGSGHGSPVEGASRPGPAGDTRATEGRETREMGVGAEGPVDPRPSANAPPVRAPRREPSPFTGPYKLTTPLTSYPNLRPRRWVPDRASTKTRMRTRLGLEPPSSRPHRTLTPFCNRDP